MTLFKFIVQLHLQKGENTEVGIYINVSEWHTSDGTWFVLKSYFSWFIGSRKGLLCQQHPSQALEKTGPFAP